MKISSFPLAIWATAVILLSACSSGTFPEMKFRAAVTADRATICGDADSDGICDTEDKCPLTPANLKVDAKGCPDAFSVSTGAKGKSLMSELPMRVNFPSRLLFEDGSAIMRPVGEEELAKLAAVLKGSASPLVLIEGHTDSRGAHTYNQRLSVMRANAVRRKLIADHGLAPERIRAIGHGDSAPVADNSSAEGRALNRRVDVLIGADAAL